MEKDTKINIPENVGRRILVRRLIDGDLEEHKIIEMSQDCLCLKIDFNPGEGWRDIWQYESQFTLIEILPEHISNIPVPHSMKLRGSRFKF